MNLNFSKWLEQNTVGTEFVDESKIDQMYGKAKISVQIVQMYDETRSSNPMDPPHKRKLLLDINVIAPLTGGVYGMYMSSENNKAISPDAMNRLKLLFPKDTMLNKKIKTLPVSVLKKYLPDLDANKIRPSDTIHVNIQKILREFGDGSRAIIEIASTIVHEATHQLEFNFYGKTGETGMKQAEDAFILWVKNNWQVLSKKFALTDNIF